MLSIQHRNINSPVRTIKGKTELFNSSVLSATGETISINNVFPQRHLIKCNVRSKNYIYYPYYNVSGTISGITYTVNEDNTITANGTATADSFFYMVQTMKLSKGTYTLSSINLTNNKELRCAIYNTDNTLDRYVYNETFTINGERLVYIYLVILNGNTVNNITYKPILEKGNTATEYTAFVPDLTAVQVNVNGTEYTPDVNGTVSGIYSSSEMLFTSTEGTVLDIEYKSFVYERDYTYKDNLKSITIERAGEDKFFGFGICQKAEAKYVDKERSINITTSNSFKSYFTAENDYLNTYPTFFIDNVTRDEKTNELKVVAYDSLYSLSSHFWNEIDINIPYTLNDVVGAICAFLGCSWSSNAIESFNLEYTNGANLEGTETLREVLNAVAEVTQTIYYVNPDDNLYFKRLDKDGTAVLTITKDDYFTLKAGENRKLGTVVSATELGDNVAAGDSDLTQYVRNNPFWELRDDIAELVENALSAIGGIAINEYECEWRGNYLLEIGDKLSFITKDDKLITSFLLDEKITYNGALKSVLKYSYTEKDKSASNPSTLGEVLKYTYARVDKVNKQIDIVVTDVNTLNKIQMTTDNILASVNSEIDDLNQKAELALTKEDVSIQIQNELSNGVDKVTTSTGFTFNDEGLTVSKTGSEMTTQITEDGMTVNRDNTEVLTADNTGVKAENLHATTYLIIGNNSRFEDFSGRTGCFWIG